MSMSYWGIVMYGVQESDLRFKEGYDGLYDISAERDEPDFFDTLLPNGKRVALFYEGTEDDSYFGFYAGYPWDEEMQGIEQKDVEDAIAQALMPYLDMKEEELRSKIGRISTYNCG